MTNHIQGKMVFLILIIYMSNYNSLKGCYKKYGKNKNNKKTTYFINDKLHKRFIRKYE